MTGLLQLTTGYCITKHSYKTFFQTTFMNALRSKARLSIKGKPDHVKQQMAVSPTTFPKLLSLY